MFQRQRILHLDWQKMEQTVEYQGTVATLPVVTSGNVVVGTNWDGRYEQIVHGTDPDTQVVELVFRSGLNTNMQSAIGGGTVFFPDLSAIGDPKKKDKEEPQNKEQYSEHGHHEMPSGYDCSNLTCIPYAEDVVNQNQAIVDMDQDDVGIYVASGQHMVCLEFVPDQQGYVWNELLVAKNQAGVLGRFLHISRLDSVVKARDELANALRRHVSAAIQIDTVVFANESLGPVIYNDQSKDKREKYGQNLGRKIEETWSVQNKGNVQFEVLQVCKYGLNMSNSGFDYAMKPLSNDVIIKDTIKGKNFQYVLKQGQQPLEKWKYVDPYNNVIVQSNRVGNDMYSFSLRNLTYQTMRRMYYVNYYLDKYIDGIDQFVAKNVSASKKTVVKNNQTTTEYNLDVTYVSFPEVKSMFSSYYEGLSSGLRGVQLPYFMHFVGPIYSLMKISINSPQGIDDTVILGVVFLQALDDSTDATLKNMHSLLIELDIKSSQQLSNLFHFLIVKEKDDKQRKHKFLEIKTYSDQQFQNLLTKSGFISYCNYQSKYDGQLKYVEVTNDHLKEQIGYAKTMHKVLTGLIWYAKVDNQSDGQISWKINTSSWDGWFNQLVTTLRQSLGDNQQATRQQVLQQSVVGKKVPSNSYTKSQVIQSLTREVFGVRYQLNNATKFTDGIDSWSIEIRGVNNSDISINTDKNQAAIQVILEQAYNIGQSFYYQLRYSGSWPTNDNVYNSVSSWTRRATMHFKHALGRILKNVCGEQLNKSIIFDHILQAIYYFNGNQQCDILNDEAVSEFVKHIPNTEWIDESGVYVIPGSQKYCENPENFNAVGVFCKTQQQQKPSGNDNSNTGGNGNDNTNDDKSKNIPLTSASKAKLLVAVINDSKERQQKIQNKTVKLVESGQQTIVDLIYDFTGHGNYNHIYDMVVGALTKDAVENKSIYVSGGRTLLTDQQFATLYKYVDIDEARNVESAVMMNNSHKILTWSGERDNVFTVYIGSQNATSTSVTVDNKTYDLKGAQLYCALPPQWLVVTGIKSYLVETNSTESDAQKAIVKIAETTNHSDQYKNDKIAIAVNVQSMLSGGLFSNNVYTDETVHNYMTTPIVFEVKDLTASNSGLTPDKAKGKLLLPQYGAAEVGSVFSKTKLLIVGYPKSDSGSIKFELAAQKAVIDGDIRAVVLPGVYFVGHSYYTKITARLLRPDVQEKANAFEKQLISKKEDIKQRVLESNELMDIMRDMHVSSISNKIAKHKTVNITVGKLTSDFLQATREPQKLENADQLLQKLKNNRLITDVVSKKATVSKIGLLMDFDCVVGEPYIYDGYRTWQQDLMFKLKHRLQEPVLSQHVLGTAFHYSIPLTIKPKFDKDITITVEFVEEGGKNKYVLIYKYNTDKSSMITSPYLSLKNNAMICIPSDDWLTDFISAVNATLVSHFSTNAQLDPRTGNVRTWIYKNIAEGLGLHMQQGGSNDIQETEHVQFYKNISEQLSKHVQRYSK